MFELLHIVFWKLVLLISATTLTSGIFTQTPTNVSLTLSVAIWVWTLPLNHYTRVSKLKMSQSDHDMNRQFKKRLNVVSSDSESCAPLLMAELQSAIRKMKGKGAAGPDNIPLSFLKSLGRLALQELLSIFNSSFSLPHCQRIWRVATIIPLLTAGEIF